MINFLRLRAKPVYFIIKNLYLFLSTFVVRYDFYRVFGIIPRGNSSFLSNSKNISVGENTSVGMDCKFYAQDKDSKISIGKNVSFNDNVTINADCGGDIFIGDNVLIGPSVIMRASNHNFHDSSLPIRNQGHKASSIFIANNVWIGAGVIVLPNVLIGENSIIGAGSVVTKDIPSDSVALGSPAKVTRKRN